MRFNLLLFLIVLTSSCSNKKCNCDIDSRSLIQKFQTENETVILNTVEQGTYGEVVLLKICDNSNKLVEEIYLRGDETKPKLDSIVKNNIYISYSYLSSTNKELYFEIPFENIVLGDGLLNKNTLKFKYLFSGRYSKEMGNIPEVLF